MYEKAREALIVYIKMKQLVIGFLVISFMIVTVPIYAEYNSKAYGGTSDETFFNRAFDWLATVGKSQEEKYRIKNKRRAIRKINRAKKAIAKRKKEIAERRNARRR